MLGVQRAKSYVICTIRFLNALTLWGVMSIAASRGH